jgi:hypothetical protein
MINKLDPRDPDSAPRVRKVRLYDADGNIMSDRHMEIHVRTGESNNAEVAIGYNVNGNLTVDKWMPQNSETMIRLLNTKHANGKPMYELLD